MRRAVASSDDKSQTHWSPSNCSVSPISSEVGTNLSVQHTFTGEMSLKTGYIQGAY